MQREKKVPQDDRTLAVGIDIVSVADVSSALQRFGDRYVKRVFTAHERAYCRSAEGATSAARFAARFAAKEAVLKALGPDAPLGTWRSIEVRREASGRCAIVLHGEAARLASRRGLREFALSMTHDGGQAAAVVVARCRSGRHGR